MSRKLQIRFMFSTHVLAFAAVVETLFLVDVTVDDLGADCRKFVQEGHFANLTGKNNHFFMPRSSIFANLKQAKKPFRKLKPPFRMANTSLSESG